jgi:hypothetical protein
MRLTRHARRIAAAVALTGTAILLPTVALASSGGASAAPAAPAARCPAGHLTAWLGIPGDGAAGSTFYQLEISNVSRTTCTLFGYPGVSAVNGRNQLGSAAGRDNSHAKRLVTLAPGATAHVILRIVDVGNFSPSACHPKTAFNLRVFPPGAFTSLDVPFTFQACSKRGPVYLSVTTTIAGTGIPGFSN